MINIPLLLAAIIIFITSLIHSIVGEKLIIIPTLKLELPQILGSDFLVKRTIRFGWHLTSMTWWCLSLILLILSRHALNSEELWILKIIGGTLLLCGLVSLIVAKGRHFSWWVFLLTSILTFIGVHKAILI